MFKKAVRTQVKLKIGLTGPSGSGKTFSALALAQGIGKKIAVIDTENASASLYADRFEFDTLILQPPYSIDKYIKAMKAAELAGYDVLITDSLSHAWAGEGGILDKKAKMDARGGNSYTNWNQLTPEQEQLFSHIQNSNIHMICTMRSKQDYVLELNDRGKQVPKKVGMAPIQRDGTEYQFTTVFDLAMDHSASTSKDRTGMFDKLLFTITPDTGKQFMAWLNDAQPSAPDEIDSTPPAPTPPTPPAEEYPEDPGIACSLCSAPVKLASNKQGYTCPNFKAKGDGHTRFVRSALASYKAQQIIPTAKEA